MSAIRPHTTPVDKVSPWDGPGAVAAAPNDAEVLRYMHAWMDDDGDPDAKQSYKFPHHRPRLGSAAVIAAVNNALARLPQANIPASDREGVERHLRKHREDAGLEQDSYAAATAAATVEQRSYTGADLRLSAADGNAPRYIEGYAAVFGRWSDDLGGFREIILPGAFNDALRDADVRALVNHDPNMILGRTRAGTLALWEDESGLRVRIAIPPTQYAQDVVALMQRGDVNQMSFAFSIEGGQDRWYMSDGEMRREIARIGRLYDVSVVTYPAYADTMAAARAHRVYISGDPIQADKAPIDDGDAAAQARQLVDVKRRRVQLLRLADR